MKNYPFDGDDKVASSIEDTSYKNKPIRGITVEEAERREQQYIRNLQLDENMNKSRETFKSMLYWFGFYNLIGLIVLLIYQQSEFWEIIYRIGIGVVFIASLLMFATFVGGMRTFAVPRGMIVADKHMGVMDDMRNARERVFTKVGGPIQGMIYGTLLIVVGAP